MDSTWITLIISTVITTIIGLLIKRYFDVYIKKQERKREEKEIQDKEAYEALEEKRREERKKDVLEAIDMRLDPLDKKLDKVIEAETTLLRNEMKSDLDSYRRQGFASSSDKANWKELYNSYRKLGGNHFREYVDEWKHEVELFPNQKEEN